MQLKLLITLCLSACFVWLPAQTAVWVSDGHPDGLQVNGVGFSSDGAHILSGTNCHPAKIRLFDRQTGNLEWDYTVSESLECIMGVGFSANGQYLATAEETGNLLIFDYQQQPPVLLSTISLGTDYAFALDFSPDSKHVAVGASGGKLKTYRLSDGAPEISVTAHTPWVTTVTYASDFSRIVTGGSDNRVKIWDTTGVLVKSMTGHGGDLTTVRITPDNQRIVSGAQDGKIKVWSLADGTLQTTINTLTDNVASLDLSPDGQWVVAACGDGLLRIWRLSDYTLVSTFGNLAEGDALTVDWSPTENVIAVGTASSKVILYQLASSTPTVEPAELTHCQVYPNPVVDRLWLQWPGEEVRTAVVYNLQGQCMAEFNGVGATQSLLLPPTLEAGCYVLKVQAMSGKATQTRLIYRD